MQLTSLLTPETRVLDVGVTAPDVGRTLAEQGFARYVGLVPPDRLVSVRSQAGDMASRFTELSSPDQAVRNSTDLLILRPAQVERLWLVRDLRHVRYIAVETGWTRPAVEARLAGLAGRLSGAARPRGRYVCGSSRFDVLEIARRKAPRARRYLSPVWGASGLVERLDAAGLRYVVLRWFENLPEVDPGEDLDVLVADEDLAAFEALLGEEPGTIPVDLYSETGLPASDFHGMSYYPPDLARQLLDRAVVHPSGARVPEPTDHLRSLAYHAVYHKGALSGLPSAVPDQLVTDPDHDYPSTLRRLADAVEVDLPETLDGVDEYLAGAGWRPPLDTLLRLTSSNPWLEHHLRPHQPAPMDPPEPVVFLLRQRLAAVVGVEEVHELLDHLGFELLVTEDLDDAARVRCATSARGGNWGQGPFRVSGGPPVTAVVALHHAPEAPGGALREKYPRLSNLDVLLAKTTIRDLVAARVGADRQFNPVHSSDNELEAWEYVSLSMPDAEVGLRAEVSRRRAQYSTDVPVVELLSRGRRAKVELVQGPDDLLVRKTFAAGYRRHLERELLALRELAPHVRAVPELVATGPNWFTCRYYENLLGPSLRPGKLLPLSVVRQMVSVLREIHQLGYDLIDAKPQNFLLDPRHGLKIVDFEFLHRYEAGKRPTFAASYSFGGIPAEYVGDVPVGGLSYDRRWRRFTGLPIQELLTGSPLSQHAHRAGYRLRRAMVGPRGPWRRLERQIRKRSRGARRQLARGYARWVRRRARVGSARFSD